MKKVATLLISIILTMISTVAFGAVELITPDDSVSAINGTVNGVLGVVQSVAVAFAVGMLLYLGIKYAMASANEKADVKNASIKYVIGAVLILGSSAILGIINTLAGEVAVTTK